MPTADSLFTGRGCPKCGDINSVLENRDPETPCILYYIHFKNKNSSFYKIGITTREIEERFRRASAHNIIMEEITYVKTKLDIAVKAEMKIIEEFYLYKIYMGHILHEIGGGTECFSIDVLNKYNVTLDDYINLYS